MGSSQKRHRRLRRDRQNITEQVTLFILQKYHPIAIVLCGSRAGSKYRAESDWDFLIFENNLQGKTRVLEWFEREQIDIQRVPASDLKNDYMFSIPNTPFKEIRVLYDKSNGLIAAAVRNTKVAYRKGPSPMSREACLSRKNYLLKKFWKLKAATNDRRTFFYFLGPFYQMVILTWFQLHEIWPLKIYEALQLIRRKDPKFYALLDGLTKNIPLPLKLKNAENILRRLFGSTESSGSQPHDQREGRKVNRA